MRSVNKEFDFEFREERTYLLCELQTTYKGETLICPIYGTQLEAQDYVADSNG